MVQRPHTDNLPTLSVVRWQYWYSFWGFRCKTSLPWLAAESDLLRRLSWPYAVIIDSEVNRAQAPLIPLPSNTPLSSYKDSEGVVIRVQACFMPGSDSSALMPHTPLLRMSGYAVPLETEP